jgi:hypothetical protein
MLYVIGKNGKTIAGWHVGEKMSKINFDEIAGVQADCDELYFIISSFSNIPYSEKRVQIWRGDFARFIVENL